MTKELERKMEAMGESIGRVILQGMLEDAWDKGVEQERRNTEKEREHAIVAFISFGIPKEKILENITISEKAYGFVKNKSIKTNAKEHLNKEKILNIDLKDFFPSIHRNRIYYIFKYLCGYCNDVSFCLTKLVTY